MPERRTPSTLITAHSSMPILSSLFSWTGELNIGRPRRITHSQTDMLKQTAISYFQCTLLDGSISDGRLPSFSTGTRQEVTDSPLQKSYSTTLSKTSSRLIAEHLPIEGSLLQSMLMLPANMLITKCRPKPDTAPLQPHFPIFRLAHRLRSRVRQPSNGIVIVQLGSHCRYFVRLPSGRILTRNRRFIRRRFGFSVHVPATPASGSPTGNVPSPTEPASSPVAPAPRRSIRSRRKPDRLMETM